MKDKHKRALATIRRLKEQVKELEDLASDLRLDLRTTRDQLYRANNGHRRT